MDPLSVGLIGCGNISETYLENSEAHDAFTIDVCADLDAERAESTAEAHGLEARSVDELLAADDVEAILNLTPPTAHADVCLQALEADKHVYTEKPLATDSDAADAVLDAASEHDRLVGAAPDTFLGAGLQTARQVIENGTIGRPIGATAVWSSPGHEHWHPNPDLYYEIGGGPGLDMGPYYLTALVALLGPATRVAGSVTTPHEQREITSEPRAGEEIDVEVPTHESAVVDFENGATATVTMSFDVQASTLPFPAFEIYGTEGTLALPDPNHFEGPVRVRTREDDDWETVDLTHDYTVGRGAGLADLAFAARGDWNQRTSGHLARHVLEILTSIRSSSTDSAYSAIDTDPGRIDPLPPSFPDRGE